MKTNFGLMALLAGGLFLFRAQAQETASVDRENVLARGQATRFSEIVARLNKGDKVAVLEEITIEKPKAGDEARWLRIALPDNATVWVHTLFVDSENKTVKPKRLNLRGGPGENFSVLGTIDQGTAVKVLSTQGDWLEIEAPEGAYAFVAASLVGSPAAPAAPVEAPVAPAVVTEVQPPAPVAIPVPAPEIAPVPADPLPAPVDTAPPVVAEEPPAKRVVQRDGIVRGTVSIQAPTHYRLVTLDNGRTINYLFTSSTNLSLARYNGMRIIVTGEEALDERWPNTPVLTIKRIQVVE